MSNKIEILSFDDWINVNGFIFRPEQYDLYKFLYEVGQQSKQAEIDELKMTNHNLSVMVAEAESYSEYWKYERDKLQKRVNELELINFDSELHFDAAKEHIDSLQKRIDEINNHLEINYDENRGDDIHSYWSGYNQALRELFEILKGDSHES